MVSHEHRCLGCMSENTGKTICPRCGRDSNNNQESPLHLKPGTILQGKYLLGRVLGQGGFGITYLAWDENLNIKLAIKEFFPQGMVSRALGINELTPSTGEMGNQFTYGLERFLAEARTLARFEKHPGIVTVRDYFQENNTAYMVMSYIDGITFEKYLQQVGGIISFQKAIEITMPVMDALREVHEVGFLHRDISPDNIVIDNNGQVILIDFGAARQDMREKSRSLSVLLKAGYAPEEQYRSKGRQGPWTDVYAVAATIYRAITGQIPPEAMDRLDEDELKHPSALGADITEAEERVLLKALAVKSNSRYRDMSDLQVALKGNAPKGTNLKGLEPERAEPSPPMTPKSWETQNQAPAPPERATALSHMQKVEYVDLYCPVEVRTYEINKNSEDLLECRITLKGLANRAVEALHMDIHCYNAFGDPVTTPPANIVETLEQDLKAPSGVNFSLQSPVLLSAHPETRKVIIEIKRVLFADRTVWQRGENDLIPISIERIKDPEILQGLKEITGVAALCYAREEDGFWQCVCGRGNFKDATNCIRCSSVKKYLLQICASKETVATEIELRCRDEDERLERRQREAEAHRKQIEREVQEKTRIEKERQEIEMKKNKKAIIIIMFASLLVILAWIGIAFFINSNNYENAIRLMETGEDLKAIQAFEEIVDFKDSEEQVKKLQEIIYEEAKVLLEEGEYKKAIEAFIIIDGYKDSKKYAIDSEYIVDYKRGTIPLSELEIGARLVDPTWEWEHRTGPIQRDGIPYSDSGVTKTVTWIVVAKNHYSSGAAGSIEGGENHVTLITEEIIGRHPFDNSTNRGSAFGSNHWGDSGKPNASYGIRKFLNGSSYSGGDTSSYSYTFYDAMSAEFKESILTTALPNKVWDNGKSYERNDKIFLPSTTELGDKEHYKTRKIGLDWDYFSGNKSRVAAIGGNNTRYWTRSPYVSDASHVRLVCSGGGLSYYNASYANDGGVRPALNLKSEILVSEIKK